MTFRWINTDGTFNTAQIMRDAIYNAKNAAGFHRTTYRKGGVAEYIGFCLSEIWKAARCEKRRFVEELFTAEPKPVPTIVTPYDTDIANMETEIEVFDMSCRWNRTSPKMAAMEARLADLKTARSEFLEAA